LFNFHLNAAPLGLYIHFPWCVRKCPYCDFNSHESQGSFPERDYVAALIRDLQQELALVEGRMIHSIFMGGGTPSLFSPEAIAQLLVFIQSTGQCAPVMEITLEANPGTVELGRFSGFYQAGVNRLSLGVQSFHDKQLKLLGRIHHGDDARRAIEAAQQAGFENINLDIMHGLPAQTVKEALADIQTALQWGVPHFSWYQLTIEPNTYFHRFPPALPSEALLGDIQTQGQALIESKGLVQYEVSAYSRPRRQCQHNVNYWLFGDYLGIGAGAHGKITTKTGVTRYLKPRQPKAYLQKQSQAHYRAQTQTVSAEALPFEFMLNALRLKKPVTASLFEARTSLPFSVLDKPLLMAEQKGLITRCEDSINVTSLGYRFLNDLVALFMV